MTVGVIGAGAWGRSHVRTLQEMGELAVVVEAHAPTREKVLADFPGVPVVADLAEALKGDAKAFVVATPAATHFDVATRILTAGKDVLVEKPLTLSSAEGERLVAAADAAGRVLMVGHLLLYDPGTAALAAALRAGRIGELRSVAIERLKLGRVRREEDVLWSFGVHDIAVMLDLVGAEPVRVDASGHAVLQPRVADDVHVHMTFPGDVRAHLHVSWLWPETRRRTTLVGSKAMLTYDEVRREVRLHRRHVGADLKEADEGDEVLFSGEAQPLRAELEHFLACVRTRARPRSDGTQGVRVLRVLERAGAAMGGAHGA
ncbi:MAG TPA: Gfo/Idh/MocA family oxidoreductase [Candidatus Thermoplasmatota archaeon]|nr:Gfo/Idh/MocA family oxidoreductase [Candidatus Thermoplasmatota archaeon]